MKTLNRLACTFGMLFLLSGPLQAAQTATMDTPQQHDARMKWFREARFGMFIHWGLYAVPGGMYRGKPIRGAGEWIMNDEKIPVAEYEQYASQFNPVKFDAKQWVAIAKNAGMKYIVITSKHHDGFNMFDSHETDYSIVQDTPFKRDPMKELAAACKDAGITFCFYHSIMDWHHPDAQRVGYNKAGHNPNFPRYVETYLKPELKELLTNYGPLGILWFDGEWINDYTPEMGQDIYAMCRELQPNIIVNNRVGKARNGMKGTDKGEGAVGDYGTPEQQIPATGIPGMDWESCMTMNDTWGFKQEDHHWKSAAQLIHNLIDCASKGGNFLLNVGPTAEGEIPSASVERLQQVGDWMKTNSEAIYATQASPFAKLSFGKCTQKPGRLYLHVENWPADGKLVVPMKNKVLKAYLLATPARSLDTAAGADGVSITVPSAAPDKIATVIALEIDGSAEAM